MTMPGFRPIDPDRELARLKEERERHSAVPSWPVLVDSIYRVPGDDGDEGMIFVHLRVAADRFSPVPADLGEKLAAVIAANWPVKP